MTKNFVKNLSNKFPAKDITDDDIQNKLKLISKRKVRKILINDNLFFGEKNIPIIAGPNGVESRKLIFNTATFLLVWIG